ncbi:DUF2778 domain-containing protein [Chryseobacterium sp. PBS4-4]|uniref:DUF2778 domain-containing protein n=1 Tax=Chryseobacterium edaphi TaxID=2976532 RepID=A0ABT2W1T8_9FLAO|nr:DUF2778 domain-containing protein [Chryseobacterium edaphi]
MFNKSTGILNIIPNVSKLNPRLSNKFVSAQTYSRLTNQDKTKFNYGIQVKNVFTGGHSESGVVSRDNSSTSNEKPIPNGNYNILDNDADTNHSGWFRLDKIDSSPHNDKDDASGRNGFRLHLGTVSWGCVTCDISQGSREDEWNIISGAINSTETETVKEKRGKQKWNPFSWLTNYGTLKVTGTDKVPAKKPGQ